MKNENVLIFNSLKDFVNETNKLYGDIFGKIIRNNLSTFNEVTKVYDFKFWTHNGSFETEPTYIKFYKEQADEYYELLTNYDD